MIRRYGVLCLILLLVTPFIVAQDDATATPSMTAPEWVVMGLTALADSNYEEALVAFDEALLVDPASTDALLARADLYTLWGRDQLAFDDYTTLLTMPNTDLNGLRLKRATVALNLREINTASSDVQAILANDPNNARAIALQSLALLAQDQPASAIEGLNRAIELAPDDAIIRAQFGEYYLAREQYTEAIDQLTNAINFDPTRAMTYNTLGIVYLQLSEFDRAITEFTNAIVRAPQIPSFYVNRAITYRVRGEFTLAINELTEVTALDDMYSEAYLVRAFTYVERANRAPSDDQALPDYELALADLLQFVSIVGDNERVPLEVRQLILELETVLESRQQ